MSIRMLIDASHPEETRVAVVHGNRVEEFDFESASKKQLKGNIYLAKVTRVEPSLQAAFVEYGGNRHGFLAFSEIHPDYYQIPVADRQALLAQDFQEHNDFVELEGQQEAPARPDHDDHHDDDHDDDSEADAHDHSIESLESDEEITEKIRNRPRLIKRHYKIQEVIKRRQILLVQVVKEERGNKGAALTTYLSLAGRYCVLMPNTLHGGGVSRKIANPADRKKLKSVLSELSMVEGMACIIRTAGLSRTKAEIKRDFDYLSRLWEGIRDLTLKSIAPALIHEEGDLIKRSIRDLYSRDIDEILVEGEEGYKAAKGFMRLLMPSHAKKVQHYQDRIPLLHKFQVEGQLDSMFSPEVRLRSGGYIVINPTEALVAIDVNSGKATREHHIEETAFKTNMEAAEEVARQLRLRDMAGLIVIDFIDMEDRNNIRNIERKLKDCLKNDRARIQIGRISPFGLMEMSRQRLRPGLLEASTRVCPICSGTGSVRSVESSALHAIRAIEEEGIRARSSSVHVRVTPDVAIYLLNRKRMEIGDMERRYGFHIEILADNSLIAPTVEIDREGTAPDPVLAAEYVMLDNRFSESEAIDAEVEDDVEEEDEAEETVRGDAGTVSEDDSKDEGGAAERATATPAQGERQESEERRRRKRRRRRRKPGAGDQTQTADGQPRSDGAQASTAEDSETSDGGPAPVEGQPAEGEDLDGSGRKRRRRGRRGGRKRSRTGSGGEEQSDVNVAARENVADGDSNSVPSSVTPALQASGAETAATADADAPKPKARPRRRKAEETTATAHVVANVETAAPAAEAVAEASAPKKRTRTRKVAAEASIEAPIAVVSEAEAEKPAAPKARTRKPKEAAPAKTEGKTEDKTGEKPARKAPVRKAKVSKAAEAEPVVAKAAPEPLIAEPAMAEAAPEAAEVPTGPKKKGWWQR